MYSKFINERNVVFKIHAMATNLYSQSTKLKYIYKNQKHIIIHKIYESVIIKEFLFWFKRVCVGGEGSNLAAERSGFE